MKSMDYSLARNKMLNEQLKDNGIDNEELLEAMLETPRHLFLDSGLGPQAYSNHPFPIGFGQTMSQPFIVGYLCDHLELSGSESVLEIGTGSGYQAAVLSRLASRVYSIERIPELALKAEEVLKQLNISNVHVKTGDGASGWTDEAPFDRILLTAAAKEIPKSLFSQLVNGGILLGPAEIGKGKQEIIKIIKTGHSMSVTRLRECTFVPLVRSGGGKDKTIHGE